VIGEKHGKGEILARKGGTAGAPTVLTLRRKARLREGKEKSGLKIKEL